MSNGTRKILLPLMALLIVRAPMSVCADEKSCKWEYGLKLLPLYVFYEQMPVNSSVEVLIPTPLPPPDDKMWARTSKSSEFSGGIMGTWRYGGFYLRKKIPYRKYLNFAIEGSFEYYLHDDIVAHWGSSSERFDKHKIGSVTVPKIMLYWEPIKYFSWGLGYGFVFLRTKTWFDNFNFTPLYYSGAKEVQTQNEVFLLGAVFKLPISNDITIGYDMTVTVPRLPHAVRVDDKGELYYVMTPGAQLDVQVFRVEFK